MINREIVFIFLDFFFNNKEIKEMCVMVINKVKVCNKEL